MKKVNQLLYLFFISALSFAASYTPTQMTKVFYHQGMLGDKVVCYFDKAPMCNTLPSSQDQAEPGSSLKKVEFFLPMAIVAGNDARKMVQKLNATKREHYEVTMTEEEKPVKGLKVSIAYDPQHIVCDYTTCDSISNQKSLAFSFHNKKALEAVQLHNGSILRSARNNQQSKPHIMLDFGHGGEDAGKIGCNLIKEKDITLQIGNRLASLLKKKGYRVSLTRNADVFVALDERTSKANRSKVDLFLSLHANACSSPTVSGIETYWTPRKTLSWKPLGSKSQSTQKIIAQLAHNLDASSLSLAQAIHDKVLQSVSTQRQVTNRKVKQSVAQVLFGTESVPSALIEMGFLTNQVETNYLASPEYQALLAQGIVEGIEGYLKTVQTC